MMKKHCIIGVKGGIEMGPVHVCQGLLDIRIGEDGELVYPNVISIWQIKQQSQCFSKIFLFLSGTPYNDINIERDAFLFQICRSLNNPLFRGGAEVQFSQDVLASGLNSQTRL